MVNGSTLPGHAVFVVPMIVEPQDDLTPHSL